MPALRVQNYSESARPVQETRHGEMIMGFTHVGELAKKFADGIKPHAERAERYEGNVTPHYGAVRAFMEDFCRDPKAADRAPRTSDVYTRENIA